MIVKSIGPNRTEVHTNKYIVLVSYSTPVAYYDKQADKWYQTDKYHSQTTTRHLSQWFGGNVPGRIIYPEFISQGVLDHLLD